MEKTANSLSVSHNEAVQVGLSLYMDSFFPANVCFVMLTNVNGHLVDTVVIKVYTSNDNLVCHSCEKSKR